MDVRSLDKAIDLLEKANADLEPELLDSSFARAVLDRYSKARRLVDYGVAAVARKVDDASVVARAAGVPVGQAKATIDLGHNLKAAPELGAALQTGTVSAASTTRRSATTGSSAPRASQRSPVSDRGQEGWQAHAPTTAARYVKPAR